MLVVDSSVWIANLRDPRGETSRKLRKIAANEQILVGDLVLLEILQGARSGEHAVRLENDMRRFPIVQMFDQDIASKAARNYRLLRARGVTIRKTPDLIIATYCLERGLKLLHADRDFDPFMMHFGLRTM